MVRRANAPALTGRGDIVTKKCLVTFTIAAGEGVAEVHVNSLHQLAVMMPASVISYAVLDHGDSARGMIDDAQLYDLLLGVIRDTDAQLRGA